MRETAVAEDQFPLLENLKDCERTVSKLPHGGFLHLEHDVPYMLIYRKKKDDPATLRLARSGASYLIISDENLDFFQRFLYRLTQKMSAKFGSFLLLEIYSGAPKSTEFVIKGPAHKLPVSLKTLKNALQQIKSRKYGVELTARIEQTKQRDLKDTEALFDIDKIKACSGTWIGLEIPPVYRSGKQRTYPLYFRKFRDQFIRSLQESIFEFIRVQTTARLASYNALGKRSIHEEVLKIDREITAIQSSYQFLLLVAPVNIQALRQRFFETHFSEVNDYSYRLLPVDPDLLKRRLYNLRIDEIDDPALAFIYNEKREEIDQELTMLKDRGSKNFFYSSIRLYKGVAKNVLAEAELILRNIPETEGADQNDLLDAKAFASMAKNEFDYFKKQAPDFDSRVHIRDDVNVMMVSNGELYLPSDYSLTKKEATALIQHEVGTHGLTFYNGSQQQLSQLAMGLADYDPLQEGIAVLSEYLVGGLCGNRLRILAGRVIAGGALLDGADFKNTFNLLYAEYGFSKEHAFNITSRIFQGGGFLKDIIYLTGLIQLRDYMAKGGNLKELLSGKFALKHVNIIRDLTERELLMPPKILPRYFEVEGVEERLKKFREGIALSKMV